MSTKSNEKFWTTERKYYPAEGEHTPEETAEINWIASYWNLEHPHRDLIVDIIRKNPVRSVLEIGCGCGANLYRIKKEFPEVRVAGCDINEDAIRTAQKQFNKYYFKNDKILTPQREYEEHPQKAMLMELGGRFVKDIALQDVELRVGNADALPFHGESFDLVLTDALLIYIGPDKIIRVLREIRRVGYNKMIFVEFHSQNFWKRLRLRIAKRGKCYAYDYLKLLSDNHFKYIKLHKIPKEVWPGPDWEQLGYIITCIR